MDDSVKKIFKVMPRAVVSYNDLEGECALDWNSTGDREDLEKLARHQKIDTDKYMIHGLSFSFRKSIVKNFGMSISFYISDKLRKDKKIYRVLTNISQSEFYKFIDCVSVELYPKFEKIDGFEYDGEMSFTNL